MRRVSNGDASACWQRPRTRTHSIAHQTPSSGFSQSDECFSIAIRTN
jgi:hypothetical protein